METSQMPLEMNPAEDQVIPEQPRRWAARGSILVATGAAAVLGLAGCGNGEQANDHLQLLAKEAQAESTAPAHPSVTATGSVRVESHATATAGAATQTAEQKKKNHQAGANATPEIQTGDKDVDAFVQKWLAADKSGLLIKADAKCDSKNTFPKDFLKNELKDLPFTGTTIPTPHVGINGTDAFSKDLNNLIQTEINKESAEANQQLQSQLKAETDQANATLNKQLQAAQEQLDKAGVKLCFVAAPAK